MLSRFRAGARSTAIVLLASLSALGISVAGPHSADCHDDCVVVVVHDASAHHVSADVRDTDGPPLHCLLCHWARSFRPRGEVVFVAAPVAATGIWINVEIFTAAPVAPAAQPPLRSPPVSPVLS